MSLTEAKKYIAALRKKQDDPYLWPDFLTGLPDKTAIIMKTAEVYRHLGKYAVHYIRIADIQPFLIKYGPERHADIIQWAAAILKTTADRYNGFVGAFSSHDFVAISSAKDSEAFISEAKKLFEKKTLAFYSKADIRKGSLFSFTKGMRTIHVGFMRLISAGVSSRTEIPKDHLISYLGKRCAEIEKNL